MAKCISTRMSDQDQTATLVPSEVLLLRTLWLGATLIVQDLSRVEKGETREAGLDELGCMMEHLGKTIVGIERLSLVEEKRPAWKLRARRWFRRLPLVGRSHAAGEPY